MQSGSGNFCRVDNAGFEHISELTGVGIIADIVFFFQFFEKLSDNHIALVAGVIHDLSCRCFKGVTYNIEADFFVAFGLCSGLFNLPDGTEEHDTTTGNNAFFSCRSRCVKRIFKKVLTLLHFRLGCGTCFDDGNSAGQFRQTFLQFFAVVVTGCLFDLVADLVTTSSNVFLFAGSFDYCGCFLAYDDFFGLA
ncbi:hypothetical protein ES703_76419 [subsurface metagenome]